MSSHRLQSNIIVGTDPTSSDIEEDNLNENLNEFERNILIDEELNINNSNEAELEVTHIMSTKVVLLLCTVAA